MDPMCYQISLENRSVSLWRILVSSAGPRLGFNQPQLVAHPVSDAAVHPRHGAVWVTGHDWGPCIGRLPNTNLQRHLPGHTCLSSHPLLICMHPKSTR